MSYPSPGESAEGPRKSSDTMQVLLVDDDKAQRMLLRTVLATEGYAVLEAGNGQEALQVCGDNPDLQLIITDLSMPEMDGFALIEAIRAQQRRYMYLIVLTSDGDKSSTIKALSMGADDFLNKPALPEELKLRTSSGFRLLQLESTEELIFGMAKLSEYRSQETGCHLERVQYYTRLLARDLAAHCPEMQISSPQAEEIARVSPLHDIGKVAIADAILHKPGKLTTAEYEMMKSHTTIGGKLLRDIHQKTLSHSMQTAFEIAMYHHEHFDGNGYPEGLEGDEIPVSARIMALADIYDALTSTRCYKKGRSHEEARELIVDERGKQLDHRVVDAFLRQEDIWQTVKRRFSD
ncbi:MAG: HD domain-containing phosphohydrolase [Thermodesulfobacteriota bacterium]